MQTKGNECALGFSRCSGGGKLLGEPRKLPRKRLLVAFPHVLQLMIHNSLIDSLRYKISLAMGEERVRGGGGGVELLNLRVIWRS